MTEYPFSFEVNGKNYNARFTIMEDENPNQVHVFEISPPDYQPEMPYIFTVNQESGGLIFALKDSKSAEYGVPISEAISARVKELGISLFDEIHRSGHEHDNSV